MLNTKLKKIIKRLYKVKHTQYYMWQGKPSELNTLEYDEVIEILKEELND